jgi:hypothetical protein
MYHAPPNSINVVLANPNFISVGECVEVDADRTPGFNSEGRIVMISVQVGMSEQSWQRIFPSKSPPYDAVRHSRSSYGSFI